MHSTNNLEDGYLGSGRRLRYSVNKHGKENHEREIIEYCDSREELKNRETEIVNLNEIAKEECINLKVGGEGGSQKYETQMKWVMAGSKGFCDRLKRDKKFREQFSKLQSEKMKQTWLNGKITPLNWTGRKHSDKTKLKMSESSKGTGIGSNNSQFGSCWITNESKNRKIMRGDNIPDGWRLGRVIKKYL